jgi:hypothetical protein
VSSVTALQVNGAPQRIERGSTLLSALRFDRTDRSPIDRTQNSSDERLFKLSLQWF